MSQRQRFIRKIVYACVIAALLLPLSWLSQPAAKDVRCESVQQAGLAGKVAVNSPGRHTCPGGDRVDCGTAPPGPRHLAPRGRDQPVPGG